MRTWPLQQTRNHLRDVVYGAIQDGPQRITRHDKDAVIVVSEKEWSRRVGAVASFGALLAESPLTSEDRPPRQHGSARRRTLFE